MTATRSTLMAQQAPAVDQTSILQKDELPMSPTLNSHHGRHRQPRRRHDPLRSQPYLPMATALIQLITMFVHIACDR